MEILNTDVLVVGGGLTGYRAAAAALETGTKVILVDAGGASSNSIMGFNAPVSEDDSPDSFFVDLEKSACEAGKKELRQVMAERAKGQVSYMESLSYSFDRTSEGEYSLIGVLGFSHPRLVHHGSFTGKEMLVLLKQHTETLGLRVVYGRMTEIWKNSGEVSGVSGFDKKGCPITINAKAVVLCAGGSSLLPGSTYPKDLCGDGYMMALRAGATLIDIEFQQFEPCCYCWPPELRGHLAVTTMLLEGGELKNGCGKAFVKKRGNHRYQVQKDQLASWIMDEIMSGRATPHGGVWYDITKLPMERIIKDHELFWREAMACGIDLTYQQAEVAPAPHTCIGGVRINAECETGVPGLFCAGENAGGVHGANRVGGCAGTETLVFGEIAGKNASSYAAQIRRRHWNEERMPDTKPPIGRHEIPSTVAKALGFYRDEETLQQGKQFLEAINQGTHSLVYVQILASLLRKESRGVFHRTDFPKTDPNLNGTNTEIRLDDDGKVIGRLVREDIQKRSKIRGQKKERTEKV